MSNDTKTLSTEEIDKDLATLEEAKIATLAASGQSAKYIKKMVDKHRILWWDTIVEDLNSKEFAVRRSAQIEYN